MIESQSELMVEEVDMMLPIVEEAYGSAEMVALDDADLDAVSGGASNNGSSTSGFSRNRMSMMKGTFAGPGGSGSFSSLQTEEIGSFAQENWDIDQ